MKKFEIGKRYSMRSACDHNCIWTYTVTARTAKTITIMDDKGRVKRCRISKYSEEFGQETIYPLGVFSMCPALVA